MTSAIATMVLALNLTAAERPIKLCSDEQVAKIRAELTRIREKGETDAGKVQRLEDSLRYYDEEGKKTRAEIHAKFVKLNASSWKSGEIVHDVVVTKEWIAGRRFVLRPHVFCGVNQYSVTIPGDSPVIVLVKVFPHSGDAVNFLLETTFVEPDRIDQTLGNVGICFGPDSCSFIRDNVLTKVTAKDVRAEIKALDRLISKSPMTRNASAPELFVADHAKALQSAAE